MQKTLSCSNICAKYSEKEVLKNISFALKQGEFICLCGPNGSGKSTLLSVLAGLNDNSLSVSAGEILIDEKTPVKSLSRKECAKLIAYMQQTEFSTWDFSVFDFVLQGRFAYSKNGWFSKNDELLVKNILEELDLAPFSERKIHSLSGGEFQKVRIARALAQEPSFLLLDEPASNLDFVYEPKLLELLKKIAAEKNIGIIISIHDINLAARYADKLALLPVQSELFFGSTEQVFTEEKLSKTFNTTLQTYTHPIYNKLQVTNEK